MAKTRKTLVGDDESNLAEVLKEVKRELGGATGLADYITQYIKDPSANPYLRNKSFSILTRMMEKVDALGTPDVVLTDEELEEELRIGVLRYLVPMPEEQYQTILAAVQEKRDAHSAREAKARLAREDAVRPVGAPPGIERA